MTCSYWTPADVQTSLFLIFNNQLRCTHQNSNDGHELIQNLFSFELFILNCFKDRFCTYIGLQLSCRLLEFVSH